MDSAKRFIYHNIRAFSLDYALVGSYALRYLPILAEYLKVSAVSSGMVRETCRFKQNALRNPLFLAERFVEPTIFSRTVCETCRF